MSEEKKKVVDVKRVFEACNVTLKDIGGQHKGDCPLCEKNGHLFVDLESGRWDCKKCHEGGNVYTFIRMWHELTCQDVDYVALAALRPGIGKVSLKGFNVGFDGDSYILPSYMIKDNTPKIRSLRRWTADPKSVKSFPTLTTGIYVANWPETDSGVVWVCEGEWDAMAWARVINALGEDDYVIAVPGANTFPADDLTWVEGKHVRLLYDNDEPDKKKNKILRPGFDGMVRSAPKFSFLGAESVLLCGWAPYPTDYMDIRDVCRSNYKDPSSIYNTINSMLVTLDEFKALHGYDTAPSSAESEGKSKLPPYVESFEEVMNTFSDVYEITDMFERCIACSFATVASNQLPGDQLWMFLVGPPSSGKTCIIEAFSKAHKYSHHLSKMTSTNLVSGMSRGEDPSVLPKLRNKCLFIKDFTAVLALPPGVQEELFGMLRDAYDRNVRVTYGNGQVRIYNDLNFTIFAGCTDEIYTKNHSSLGERFLKIEILDASFSPAMQARAALLGLNTKTDLTSLQEKVYGYCRYLFDKCTPEETIDDETIDWLVAVASIVAYLRTAVKRTDGNMSYRPRPEVPARLATQLRKLYLSLKMVCPNKPKEWLKLTVEKVAMDSCIGWALEFVVPIIKRRTGITTQEIAELQQVAPNHVKKVLHDLQEIGVVQTELGSNNTGRPGRMSNYWIPDPRFIELWESAGVSLQATRKFTPSRCTKRSKKERN